MSTLHHQPRWLLGLAAALVLLPSPASAEAPHEVSSPQPGVPSPGPGLPLETSALGEPPLQDPPEDPPQPAVHQLEGPNTTVPTLLADRVQALEQQTARLRQRAFSPTTRLSGEAILAVGAVMAGRRADGSSQPVGSSLFMGGGIELSFETSFTGEDELEITLEARNLPELEDATGTAMANMSFDGDEGFGRVELDELSYQTPVLQRGIVTLSAVGGGLGDYVPTVNPLFNSSTTGSISTFGKENPILRQGSGTGLGLSYDVSDALNLSVGYVARQSADPAVGLTGGFYGAIAQATLRPTHTLTLALTYIRSNAVDTGTGSPLAGNPFGGQSAALLANSYGAEIGWAISPGLSLGARLGLMEVETAGLVPPARAQIFTWAVLLGLTDLATEGDLLGLVWGQPPKVTSNSLGDQFIDSGSALHLEAFYRLPLSPNLSLTPGLLVVAAPNHAADNDPLSVATLRLAFEF